MVMGYGDDLWVFLLVWPSAIIAALALILSMVLTEAERDDWGRHTESGRRLNRCRTYILLNCGSCILAIFLDNVLLRDPRRYEFVAWRRYWPLFLLVMIGADVWAILAMFEGFKTGGKGAWILRTATLIISVLSILATIAPYAN